MGQEDVDDEDEPHAPVSRPTVRPDFDPRTLLEESEVRERAPTITDEVALETARQASLPSKPPLARPAVGSMPEIVTSGEEELSGDDAVAILRDRLSPLDRVPHLAKKITDLGSVVEDPKTAYILGFVDGLLPLDTIVEVTGLPERDTLEVLDRMVEQGHIVFKPKA